MINYLSFDKNKLVEYILFTMAIIAFCSFLVTSFNSFYWMDDFWKRYEMLNQGFFSFQMEIYFKWDGRGISPVYSLRNFILYLFDYPQAWIVTLIGMAFLTGTGNLLMRIIAGGSWNRELFFQKVLLTILCSLILVMVFRPHLSRSLYWGTGIYYMISNFFTVLTVFFLIKYPNKWWNFLLIFFTCTSGPNNGLMVIAFLVLGKWFRLISLSRKILFINLLIGVICLLIIVLAPGNTYRGGDSFVWSFGSMIQGFFLVLKEYLGMSLWVFIGGILLGIILDLKVDKNELISLKFSIFFLLLSFVSILPFLPFPSAASKHTGLFFQSFFLISLVFFIAYLKVRFMIPLNENLNRFLSITFICYFLFQISIQLRTGYEIKNLIDQRFLVLEANKGKADSVIFNSIIIPSNNWVSRFWDMRDNSEYVSNKYYQKYFETGPILVYK